MRGAVRELPASTSIIGSETEAEINPMRDREKINAAKMMLAANTKNTNAGSFLADKIAWRGRLRPSVARRRAVANFNAKATAKGSTISKNPAKWLRLIYVPVASSK